MKNLFLICTAAAVLPLAAIVLGLALPIMAAAGLYRAMRGKI